MISSGIGRSFLSLSSLSCPSSPTEALSSPASLMTTSAASPKSWADAEDIRRSSAQSPTLGMPSRSMSRPTSPAPLARAFRFSSHNDAHQSNGGARHSIFPDVLTGGRLRTSSSSGQSKTTAKGKEKEPTESTDSNSTGYDPDPFLTPYGASPYAAFETVRDARPEIPPSFPKRSRNSLLFAASDAFNLKFGRRRRSLRAPPQPMVLSEVIEITASRRDEEDEERERLRDAAAQSIGLGPELLDNSLSREDVSGEEDALGDDGDMVYIRDDERTIDHHTMSAKSTHGSNLSVSMLSMSSVPSHPLVGRHRAGSVALSTQSRLNPTPSPSVPAFPATASSLAPFIQMSSTLPKHHPSPSLFMFHLSKQWKNRFILLTTARHSRGHATPPVSYLHLFKSPGPEEKEQERLEINEDSVVFIADEDVGGRGNVVKVGGVDVGALKRDLNTEENGHTMWLLQILESGESQKWIAAIKSAILAQRSLRKGLGIPSHTLGGSEPRGDMDVMLSMRAQGLLPSPTQTEFAIGSPRSGNTPLTTSLGASDSSGTVTSSNSNSLRGHPTPKPPQTNAVLALKGLFAGTSRPRSPSRATSIDSERDVADESFGTMGNNLLSMLRSNANGTHTHDGRMTPLCSPKLLPISSPITTSPRMSVPPILSPKERNLERRIVHDHDPEGWAFSDIDKENLSRRSGATSPSLQPPPRKRPWTLTGTSGTNPQEPGIYSYNNGNASTSFGVGQSSETAPPVSPSLSGGSSSTQEQKPRAPSLSSVSTFASGENGGAERSNSPATKRWSRQGVLPQRLTPPAGPPPAVPTTQNFWSTSSSPGRAPVLHPYAAERSPSRSSSRQSPPSPQSFGSAMPAFSKRASTSSAHSISAASINGMNVPGNRPLPSNRMSMPPPPRPAPNAALPPTPVEGSAGHPGSAPSIKTSFRDSITHRALRLSLVPPRDPPSTVLPPRPDDLEYRSHRRSSSSDSNTQSRSLYPIPGSPIPPGPAFPPPTGPLPPTPASPTALSRLPSIKQRLRMRSAPSAATPVASPPSTPITAAPRSSTPSTPIGEPITTQQNDPNFLLSSSPNGLISAATSSSGNAHEPPAPDSSPDLSELTSLSPPPRRGSRPIATPGREEGNLEEVALALPEETLISSGESIAVSFEYKSPSPPPRRGSGQITVGDEEDRLDISSSDEIENPLPSLSQHGSAVSLGIVSI